MKKAKIQTFHWMQSSNIAMKSRVKKWVEHTDLVQKNASIILIQIVKGWINLGILILD